MKGEKETKKHTIYLKKGFFLFYFYFCFLAQVAIPVQINLSLSYTFPSFFFPPQPVSPPTNSSKNGGSGGQLWEKISCSPFNSWCGLSSPSSPPLPSINILSWRLRLRDDSPPISTWTGQGMISARFFRIQIPACDYASTPVPSKRRQEAIQQDLCLLVWFNAYKSTS